MKNRLGMVPGLPSTNTGDHPRKVPGLDKSTVRQRLENYRSLPQCARCHNRIAQFWFTLVNLNTTDNWRNQEEFGYKVWMWKNDSVINATVRRSSVSSACYEPSSRKTISFALTCG